MKVFVGPWWGRTKKNTDIKSSQSWRSSLLYVRLLYIGVEVFYNIYLIRLCTNSSTTLADIDEIVNIGHWLSAVGITLLVAPIVLKNLKPKNALLMVLLILPLGVKTTITHSVDYVIDSIREYSYEAYYINLYRLGIVAGKVDSSLIPDHVDTNSMDGRLFLVNIYSALFVDDELVAKMKAKASPAARELVFNNRMYEFNQFASAIREIASGYDQIFTHLIKLNLETNDGLKDAWGEVGGNYKKLLSELEASYKAYEKAANSSLDKYQEIIDDGDKRVLRRIIVMGSKYKRNPKHYDPQYQKLMGKIFPNIKKKIPITAWCSPDEPAGLCSYVEARKSIVKYGRVNIENRLGYPLGLNLGEFSIHKKTKAAIGKSFNVTLPPNFGYRNEEFKRIYLNSIQEEADQALEKIDREAKKHLGLSDAKVYLNWKNVVLNSPKVRKAVFNIMPEPFSNKERKMALWLLAHKDLRAQYLKDYIYLPMLGREIEGMLYTKKDFSRSKQAAQDGRNALVALVAPALGVTLSMLSLILNIASALATISANRYPERPVKPVTTWVTFMAAVFTIPILIGGSGVVSSITDHLHDHPWVQLHLWFVEQTIIYEFLLDIIYGIFV